MTNHKDTKASRSSSSFLDRHWLPLAIAVPLAALCIYAISIVQANNKLQLAQSTTLRIGYQQSPPYQLVSENGERGGVGLDIITEAASRLDLELDWVFSQQSPDENFAKDAVDLWPIVTDLPYRRDNFYISKPIYENSLGVLFIEADGRQGFSDLRNGRIAFYNREPGLSLTQRLLPNATLVPMPSHSEAIDAVFKEECDGAFLWSTKTNSIDFEESISNFSDKPFRFHYFNDEKITCAVAANYKNRAAMAAADLLREEIRLLVREGFVHETYFRYFLDPENEISSYFYLDDLESTSKRQFIVIAILIAVLVALLVLALQLRHSKKVASAANEAKSQFLATMSHEFRTPLNGIIGMTQLTRMTSLNEEQKEYIEVVSQSADALLTIVNDILDISAIEAGKIKLESAPLAIRDLLHGIVPFFELTASQKGLVFESNIESSCPDTFIADGARLRQILFNLLGNAIKFTAKGKISLNVSVIQLQNGDHVLFEVSDTGIGIPENRHHDIFNAFTQVDGSNNREYGGTGLGLSISRHLVDLMNGELHIESVLNQGSVFSVSIPLIPIEDNKARLPLKEAFSRNPSFDMVPMQVLLVDDNPMNLKTIEAIMHKLGHVTTTAKDGIDALNTFKVRRYDLILLDLQMPNIDGWKTARLIRQKEATASPHVPIIALSAYPCEGVQGSKFSDNIDGFLRKPIEIRLLVKEMTRILTSKKTNTL